MRQGHARTGSASPRVDAFRLRACVMLCQRKVTPSSEFTLYIQLRKYQLGILEGQLKGVDELRKLPTADEHAKEQEKLHGAKLIPTGKPDQNTDWRGPFEEDRRKLGTIPGVEDPNIFFNHLVVTTNSRWCHWRRDLDHINIRSMLQNGRIRLEELI
jgi:hypothetical protein